MTSKLRDRVVGLEKQLENATFRFGEDVNKLTKNFEAQIADARSGFPMRCAVETCEWVRGSVRGAVLS